MRVKKSFPGFHIRIEKYDDCSGGEPEALVPGGAPTPRQGKRDPGQGIHHIRCSTHPLFVEAAAVIHDTDLVLDPALQGTVQRSKTADEQFLPPVSGYDNRKKHGKI
jgi:hypothetical protein